MQGRWREAYVQWRGLIAEQAGNGQSVVAFCRERGIKTGQFFAWKQRLRKADDERFVEVHVEKTEARAPTAHRRAIEVHLTEGRRIFVEPGFDAEHLRAVVAALEAR